MRTVLTRWIKELWKTEARGKAAQKNIKENGNSDGNKAFSLSFALNRAVNLRAAIFANANNLCSAKRNGGNGAERGARNNRNWRNIADYLLLEKGSKNYSPVDKKRVSVDHLAGVLRGEICVWCWALPSARYERDNFARFRFADALLQPLFRRLRVPTATIFRAKLLISATLK